MGCGLALLQSYLFELPLKLLEFYLSHRSELNYLLVRGLRPLLHSGREDTYLHLLLFLA